MQTEDFNPMAVAGRPPEAAVKAAAKAITRKAKGKAEPETGQAEALTPAETGNADAHGVARDQLRAFVERIERLEEEKATIGTDIKDVYGEAKSMGFDTKILKRVIALRKKDDQERMEEDLILDTYLQALGMTEGR
nr:hypothetical protein REQ54_00806 [Rhizobium sp. Q54]